MEWCALKPQLFSIWRFINGYCDDGAGWYEYKTVGHAGATGSRAQTKAHKDEVQKRAELQWLKARLDARLKRMEASAERDTSRGALVVAV